MLWNADLGRYVAMLLCESPTGFRSLFTLGGGGGCFLEAGLVLAFQAACGRPLLRGVMAMLCYATEWRKR